MTFFGFWVLKKRNSNDMIKFTYWVTTVSFWVLLSIMAFNGKGKHIVKRRKKRARTSEKIMVDLTMSRTDLGFEALAIIVKTQGILTTRNKIKCFLRINF